MIFDVKVNYNLVIMPTKIVKLYIRLFFYKSASDVLKKEPSDFCLMALFCNITYDWIFLIHLIQP